MIFLHGDLKLIIASIRIFSILLFFLQFKYAQVDFSLIGLALSNELFDKVKRHVVWLINWCIYYWSEIIYKK